MKPKYLSLIVVLGCAALNLTIYQNCSPAQVAVTDAQLLNKGDGMAFATDPSGNFVPVRIDDPADLMPEPAAPIANQAPQPMPSEPTPTPEVVGTQPMPSPNDDQPKDEVVVVNPDMPEKQPEPTPQLPDPAIEKEVVTVMPTPQDPSKDMAEACGLSAKAHDGAIDIAQFENGVNLEIVKGDSFIYSSDSSVQLKSLSIEVAKGRTTLCNVRVIKLDVKKGRLDVFHSEILEIGEMKGMIFPDSESVLPAGVKQQLQASKVQK